MAEEAVGGLGGVGGADDVPALRFLVSQLEQPRVAAAVIVGKCVKGATDLLDVADALDAVGAGLVALARAGRSILARMPMMAMTTSSSMRVNPCWLCFFIRRCLRFAVRTCTTSGHSPTEAFGSVSFQALIMPVFMLISCGKFDATKPISAWFA